jgi:Mycothiol maleylpyruvate isomerase N-terminal domain
MTTTALTCAAGLRQTPPDEAASLATEQLTAYVAELRALDPADWSKPMDCSRWDVRQIAAHIAGELDESAHVTVLTRHLHGHASSETRDSPMPSTPPTAKRLQTAGGT